MKTLVDVLASFLPETEELDEALEVFCASWGVYPIWNKDGSLNEVKTIHMLAKYSLEHGRKET